MLPYAVVAAARLKRARSVLIMHDLYPDVLVMAGLLKPRSVLTKPIRGMNALMFRALDAVITIGRDTEQLLRVIAASRATRSALFRTGPR